MKGRLYVITNNINGKQYVGKTYDSLSNRWRDHLKKSKSEINRPLYRAIAKYGKDSFSIKEIAEYEEDILENEEELLIVQLNTYGNGYNATLGGDGRKYIEIDLERARRLYLELGSIKITAAKLGICARTLTTFFKNHDVLITPVENHLNAMRKACGKKIELVDTGEVYDSISDCARALIDADLTTGSIKQVASNISRVVTGSRKSYLQMNFRYSN